MAHHLVDCFRFFSQRYFGLLASIFESEGRDRDRYRVEVADPIGESKSYRQNSCRVLIDIVDQPVRCYAFRAR